MPEVIKAAGVPFTIVEKCVEKMREIKSTSRQDSIQRRSSVWAVFDVDVHPKLDDAIALARKNGIPVCISNPCIEVWGMMHLGLFERPSSRHEAQAALAAAMPPYHHANSPILPWETCRALVKDAISNSATTLKRRSDDGNPPPRGNPTTNFFELLAFLNEEYEPPK